MKKLTKKGAIYGLLSSVLIALLGCNNVLAPPIETVTPDVNRTSAVSQRIGELKAAGLLDSLLNGEVGRSVANPASEIDSGQLAYFINNTDDALAEIAQSENGDVELRFINALFGDSTVGEIADIMAEISEDMSKEYLIAMEELSLVQDMTNSQSRSAVSTKNTNVRDIRIGFYSKNNSSTSRGAYGQNFDWSTIAWYSGFCAATIAGAYASACWLPWISIPGYIAAVGGAISMVAQLAIWYNCSEFKQFTSRIIDIVGSIPKTGNYNAATHASKVASLNGHFSGPMGDKLATIAIVTGATVTACYFSPLGITIKSSITSAWAAIKNFISSVLPSWFTVSVTGLNPFKILFTISL